MAAHWISREKAQKAQFRGDKLLEQRRRKLDGLSGGAMNHNVPDFARRRTSGGLVSPASAGRVRVLFGRLRALERMPDGRAASNHADSQRQRKQNEL